MPQRTDALSAPVRPTTAHKRKAARSEQLKQLNSEARKLLEAKRAGTTLMYSISREPHEDQIVFARAIHDGKISPRDLHAALNGRRGEGYRRRIIDLCKKGQVLSED